MSDLLTQLKSAAELQKQFPSEDPIQASYDLAALRSLQDNLDLAAVVELLEAKDAEIERLRAFAIDIRDNYDCDDAHHVRKYGAPCRCCEASRLLGECND